MFTDWTRLVAELAKAIHELQQQSQPPPERVLVVRGCMTRRLADTRFGTSLSSTACTEQRAIFFDDETGLFVGFTVDATRCDVRCAMGRCNLFCELLRDDDGIFRLSAPDADRLKCTATSALAPDWQRQLALALLHQFQHAQQTANTTPVN